MTAPFPIMKKAYIVYQPNTDYGDNWEVYLVCPSMKTATKYVNFIAKWMPEYLSKLPVFPPLRDDEKPKDNPAWMAVNEQREKIIAETVWPYGVSLAHEVPFDGRYSWEQLMLIQEVPAYS